MLREATKRFSLKARVEKTTVVSAKQGAMSKAAVDVLVAD